MTAVNRRIFVLGASAALGASLWPVSATGAAARMVLNAAPILPYPFRLGVASGDPSPDGVVLWTRLAPSPLDDDGLGGMPSRPIAVDWQVATDEYFSRVVRSGTVEAYPHSAHSVHVEPTGLRPGTDYWYRFRTAGHISPIGRTRTAPDPAAKVSALTVLVASCSHFESGYFTAYRHMAAEENAGLVLHLGDYIYEYGPDPNGLRTHTGSGDTMTLADYRARHAQYKTDPDLQAAHAAVPWVVVPDDHEVANNYAGVTPPHRSQLPGFRQRRSAAYRAYYENMPLRAAAAATEGRLALYRRFQWGRLARIHLLDTRQFRTRQVDGDERQRRIRAAVTSRSVMGGQQERWLLDGLGERAATWDLIGQQVYFARMLDAMGVANTDAWDGYRANRDRLQRGWLERKVRNPVVLTGDVHRAWANDLRLNYADTDSPAIGVELVTTSITSDGDGTGDVPRGMPRPEPARMALAARPGPKIDPEVEVRQLLATNPHLGLGNCRRGYLRVGLTPSQLTADFRVVPKVTERGHPVGTLASFAVSDGRPGLERLS